MSRKIFKHMTKEQIKKNKKIAKHRKNKSLSDGEFRRTMAQYRPKGDSENDLPIVDMGKIYTKPEEILDSYRNLIDERKSIETSKKRTLRIINADEAVQRIIPSLKVLGIYKKYIDMVKNKSCYKKDDLRAVKNLLFERTKI